MNLTELQELMRLDLQSPVYAWITVQLMKGIWKFEFASFLDLLQKFDSNPSDFFTLVYLELDYQRIRLLD
jgi:hypothetical protein